MSNSYVQVPANSDIQTGCKQQVNVKKKLDIKNYGSLFGNPTAQVGYRKFLFSFSVSVIPCWSLGCLTRVRLQQPQNWRYPFLAVCAVFTCVQTMVWLPVSEIFIMHTDVGVCHCTTELYEDHRESAPKVNSGRKILCCTWESNSGQGLLCLAFQANALPTEPQPASEADAGQTERIALKCVINFLVFLQQSLCPR